MKRITVGFIALMLFGWLAAPRPADTQQQGKIARIGFLGHGQASSARNESFLAAFRQGMREHGYLEGQHYVLEDRWMGESREQFSASVTELVQLPVDVILAQGLRRVLIAKQVTTAVPIVVATAISPVELGLIASLAHPGGNVTGMAYPAGPTLAGKSLEFLMEITPPPSSVALVWNATNPVLAPYKEAAAGGVGLLLVQMAKQCGAHVFGTVSTEEKAALALEAGADEAILYSRQDFETEVKRLTNGQGVNVVYDSVGKTTFDPAILSAKGSLFLTRPSLFHYIADRASLEKRAGDVLSWIASGKLKMRIEFTFPLANVAEAHRSLEGRKTTGKVLLIP